MHNEIIQSIKGITSDSRAVKQSYLFAALKGVNHDGADFIDTAIHNGATHILAQSGTAIPDGVIKIESDNPRLEFAKLCAQFYGPQPDNIIAVTGTNGKTSVADFIRQIFEQLNLKSASLGTLGLISNHYTADNVMTTPDPVHLHAMLADLKNHNIDYVAMEASSHGLDQYRLDGVRPKVAAFTNLTQDHLDYHGDMESYFNAKARLFTEVLDGIAVVNGDDEWGQQLLSSLRGANSDDAIQNGDYHKNSGLLRSARNDGILTYGAHGNANFQIVEHLPHESGQSFALKYEGQNYHIDLNLIGAFQAHNVMCATVCCVALGLDIGKIIDALPKLKTVRGRMELATTKNGASAFIDYAHTPDALEKALQSLRPHVKNRLIVVFGAGGNRDKTKRPLMGQAAAQYADHVIVTDDNPRGENADDIRNQIMSACRPNADNIGDRAKAIHHGVSLLQTGDILIVAGKGHEQGQMINGINHPFDDLSVTKKAMEEN
jgi:UDP-N-acetylmuramoyl-L-alanyl-D-glutamate--2,6-diaminopimelate ligase